MKSTRLSPLDLFSDLDQLAQSVERSKLSDSPRSFTSASSADMSAGQGGSGPALHAPAAAPALALAPTATAPAEAAVPARDTSPPPTYAAVIAPAPSPTTTPTPTEATRTTHVLGATMATLSPAVDLPFHLTMLTSTIRDLQGTIRDLRHVVHVNHPHVLSILLSTISLELYIQLKRLPPLSIGSLRPNYQWLHALGHLSLALNYILTMNMR